MSISGLVITLSQDAVLASSATDSLERHTRVETGPIESYKLPAVLDTSTPHESEELCEWIRQLPGVEFVDVVFVGFEDDETEVVSDAERSCPEREPR